MTEEEIYQKLGLEDPVTFAIRAMKEGIAAIERGDRLRRRKSIDDVLRDAERQIGRTTARIVTGLSALSEGTPIYFRSAIGLRMAKVMVQRAKKYAVTLGLPPGDIRIAPSSLGGAGSKPNALVFNDDVGRWGNP